jgi:hypothetical protein
MRLRRVLEPRCNLELQVGRTNPNYPARSAPRRIRGGTKGSLYLRCIFLKNAVRSFSLAERTRIAAGRKTPLTQPARLRFARRLKLARLRSSTSAVADQLYGSESGERKRPS